MEKITSSVDITQEEMMFEAAQLLKPPTREAGEMTSTILSKKSGLSMKTSLNILIELADEGYLTMRKVIESGHETNAYTPVGEGGWAEIISLLEKRRR